MIGARILVTQVHFFSLLCHFMDSKISLSIFFYGSSSFCGFSGGPLLRQEDGSLIGVMNFVNVKNGNLPKAVKLVDYQACAAVDFYYDWIANVTGLKMPKC